ESCCPRRRASPPRGWPVSPPFFSARSCWRASAVNGSPRRSRPSSSHPIASGWPQPFRGRRGESRRGDDRALLDVSACALFDKWLEPTQRALRCRSRSEISAVSGTQRTCDPESDVPVRPFGSWGEEESNGLRFVAPWDHTGPGNSPLERDRRAARLEHAVARS